MSTPQLEDGFTMIANSLFEAILAGGFSQRELLVLLTILRKTDGFQKAEDDMSASQIGDMCKLARPHVTATLNQLAQRKVINKRTGRFGSIVSIQKDPRAWMSAEQTKRSLGSTDSVQGCTESVHVPIPYSGDTDSVRGDSTDSVHTKENLPKENQQKKSHTTTSVVVADSEADGARPTKPVKPECPHQQIIALYHEILPVCPEVRDWTPARAQQLRARWNENPRHQDLDYWRRYFEYVGTCGFLVGKRAGRGGRPFFASLEWLTKAENFAKVRERRYEERAA